MNLNTTFVVSAIQVVARAVLRRRCRDYAAAGCSRYRSPRILERVGLPLSSRARLSLPHGVAFFLYLPPFWRQRSNDTGEAEPR
jgi:hypothetical protein